MPCFDNATEAYGLEKIKAIGGACLAVSGVPDPGAGHPMLACFAALATVDARAKREHQERRAARDVLSRSPEPEFAADDAGRRPSAALIAMLGQRARGMAGATP